MTQHKQVSDDTANAIDEEVRRIIDINYKRAQKILKDKVDILHAMAKSLIKYETIDQGQIKEIMEGREPSPPADWEDNVEPKSPDGGSEAAEADSAAGKIGEPAQEH